MGVNLKHNRAIFLAETPDCTLISRGLGQRQAPETVNLASSITSRVLLTSSCSGFKWFQTSLSTSPFTLQLWTGFCVYRGVWYLQACSDTARCSPLTLCSCTDVLACMRGKANTEGQGPNRLPNVLLLLTDCLPQAILWRQ